MIRALRNTILTTTLFAGVAVPAFAAGPLGSPADYVLNPNGKEVAQSARGGAAALGFDPWYVPGSDSRVGKLTTVAEATRQVIDLRDGGQLVMQKGGMAHYDAAGNLIAMKDGAVMEAKDGSKLMMKNDAMWRQLSEVGARSADANVPGANRGQGTSSRQ